MTHPAEQREARMWWLVDDDGLPREVQGFDCGPDGSGYWWVPSRGCSMPPQRLYADEAAAGEAAITEAEADLHKVQSLLTRLARGDRPAR